MSSNVGIVKLIQQHYKKTHKNVDAINDLGLGTPLGIEIKGDS